MAYDELRDLELAGVRWELTDGVAAAATPAAAPMPTQATVDSAQNTANNVTNLQNMTKNPNIVPPIAPLSPETAALMAARPTDTGSLCRMLQGFNHPLRATCTNVVCPEIPGKTDGLLVITDMPGSDDDAAGKILTGAVGELFDKMFTAIGIGRDAMAITPLVFWRTPGGRTPSRMELDLSRPFVDRVIEMTAPRVIVTLGTLAAAEIAGATLPAAHGNVISHDGGYLVVPIYHPNYLLLKPSAKRDAWTALQQVQNLLKSPEK